MDFKTIVSHIKRWGQDPVRLTTWITVFCSSLVILSAMILGFAALKDLFQAIGLFHWGLGWLFPLLFDLAEIAAAVAVLNAKLQGEEDKFAWRLVLAFTGLGVVANTSHACLAMWLGEITRPQAVLAVVFTSLFPVSVALVTHLVKSVIERQIGRGEIVVSMQELQNRQRKIKAQIASGRASLERLKLQSGDDKVSKLQQDKRSAYEERLQRARDLFAGGMSEDEIMAELGVKDKRTIRRYLNGGGAK